MFYDTINEDDYAEIIKKNSLHERLAVDFSCEVGKVSIKNIIKSRKQVKEKGMKRILTIIT